MLQQSDVPIRYKFHILNHIQITENYSKDPVLTSTHKLHSGAYLYNCGFHNHCVYFKTIASNGCITMRRCKKVKHEDLPIGSTMGHHTEVIRPLICLRLA